MLKKTACVPNIEICLFIFDGIVVRFDVTSGWLMLVDMVKYALFSFVICYFSKLVVYWYSIILFDKFIAGSQLTLTRGQQWVLLRVTSSVIIGSFGCSIVFELYCDSFKLLGNPLSNAVLSSFTNCPPVWR